MFQNRKKKSKTLEVKLQQTIITHSSSPLKEVIQSVYSFSGKSHSEKLYCQLSK